MIVVIGLITSRTHPKRTVPALPETKAPVMIDRDGSRKTTPRPDAGATPEGKPGFR